MEKGESINGGGMVQPKVPGLNTERTHSVDAEEYNDTVDVSFGGVWVKDSDRPNWIRDQGKVYGGVGSYLRAENNKMYRKLEEDGSGKTPTNGIEKMTERDSMFGNSVYEKQSIHSCGGFDGGSTLVKTRVATNLSSGGGAGNGGRVRSGTGKM
jgi:hypothetical protein